LLTLAAILRIIPTTAVLFGDFVTCC